MNTLNAHAPETWLEIIWNALQAHRETSIPEGLDAAYDAEWGKFAPLWHGCGKRLGYLMK